MIELRDSPCPHIIVARGADTEEEHYNEIQEQLYSIFMEAVGWP